MTVSLDPNDYQIQASCHVFAKNNEATRDDWGHPYIAVTHEEFTSQVKKTVSHILHDIRYSNKPWMTESGASIKSKIMNKIFYNSKLDHVYLDMRKVDELANKIADQLNKK